MSDYEHDVRCARAQPTIEKSANNREAKQKKEINKRKILFLMCVCVSNRNYHYFKSEISIN